MERKAKPAPTRVKYTKQSRYQSPGTADVAASQARHRQILHEIERRQKRLNDQSISPSEKTSRQAHLRLISSRLTSAEQLGRVPGNEKASNDILTVISTELRKFDRSMLMHIAQASTRKTYS